jgi:NAD(P) transhydrogenase subunit beta
MSANISALLYLVSGICFIMALKGLSSAATSRSGNLYGIMGMAIAILTTLLMPSVSKYGLIILGVVAGGAIGITIAKRIQMTAPSACGCIPQPCGACGGVCGSSGTLPP